MGWKCELPLTLPPDGHEIYLVITKQQSEIVLAKLTGGTPWSVGQR